MSLKVILFLHRGEGRQPAGLQHWQSPPLCSPPMMQQSYDPPQTEQPPPPEPELWKQVYPQPGRRRRRRSITDSNKDLLYVEFPAAADRSWGWLTDALDAWLYRLWGKATVSFTSASSVVLVELLDCITHTSENSQ